MSDAQDQWRQTLVYAMSRKVASLSRRFKVCCVLRNGKAASHPLRLQHRRFESCHNIKEGGSDKK